jgi:hypothetical protein
LYKNPTLDKKTENYNNDELSRWVDGWTERQTETRAGRQTDTQMDRQMDTVF